MTNPVVDLVGDRTGRIIPIYPQSEKHRVTSWDQARWMEEVLERAGDFAEPVPEAVLDRLDLAGRTWAFRHIHAPEALSERDQARRRLVFDELLRLQLALVLRKRAVEREAKGIQHTDRRGRRAGSCAASTSTCRSRSPPPSSGRSARSPPTSPAPTRCTGSSRATSARARRSSPSARCSSPCRAATRAR